jgi:hypothetical protein
MAWSAVALAGITFAVMVQVLLAEPPQPVQTALNTVIARNKAGAFMPTTFLAG